MSHAPWWKNCVIYQIYPKSFRDSDGDGIGDLRGIIEKLDYIADLGVGAIWLSPIFASPMIDNGYDVSDYTAINPLFGTMDDFDNLVAQAARRNLRLILDIALNHTSTQHPWFLNACAGGERRDWYWWREGRCGGAPNNWKSIFGGPAWTKMEGQSQFYMHLFDKSQADLNWENPAVRNAIYESMRFWLDRGVGGFRLDVVTVISKDPELRDVVDTRLGPFYRHLADGPRLHEFLREMHGAVFAHYDCVAIGEAPGVDPARAARLVDPSDPMLDMLYHFDLVEPKLGADGALDVAAFKNVFNQWDKGIGAKGWNSVVLSNHDLGRITSRFGDDETFRDASATAFLALVLTQRATPFLYQGDELGLVNTPILAIDEIDDIWARNLYDLAIEEGAGESAAFAAALRVTRDHARTPFPWANSGQSGFTNAQSSWLKPNPRNAHLNAASQMSDAESVRAFAKALIALRRADSLWIEGDCEVIPQAAAPIFAYKRKLEGRGGTVVLNLSGAEQPISIMQGATPILCNYPSLESVAVMRPWEARVYGQ